MTTASAPVANTPGTPPDGPAFKAAAREQWDRSAPGWNAHTAEIRAWLRPATDAMIDMASGAQHRDRCLTALAVCRIWRVLR